MVSIDNDVAGTLKLGKGKDMVLRYGKTVINTMALIRMEIIMEERRFCLLMVLYTKDRLKMVMECITLIK